MEGGYKRANRSCGEHPLLSRENALTTCSAAGAVDIGFFIDDMEIVLHTPRSCAYIMSSFHDRMFSNDSRHKVGPFVPSETRLFSTDITDDDAIFGAASKLETLLEERVEHGAKNIMVITTCVAGIIGDDSYAVVKRVRSKHPEVRISFVKTDGNMTGHMGEGLRLATYAMLDYVDVTVQPQQGCVNILSSSFTRLRYAPLREELLSILDLMGLRINCMFIGGCRMEDIVNLRRGMLNILITDSGHTKEIAEEIRNRTGIDYVESPAPIGFERTASWVKTVGDRVGTSNESQEYIISTLRSEYELFLAESRALMNERAVGIYVEQKKDLGWLMELLADMGCDIQFIGFGSSNPRCSWNPKDMDIVVRELYDPEDLQRDLDEMCPDLLITNTDYAIPSDCHQARLEYVGVGVKGLIKFGRYLMNCLKLPVKEGWR